MPQSIDVERSVGDSQVEAFLMSVDHPQTLGTPLVPSVSMAQMALGRDPHLAQILSHVHDKKWEYTGS